MFPSTISNKEQYGEFVKSLNIKPRKLHLRELRIADLLTIYNNKVPSISPLMSEDLCWDAALSLACMSTKSTPDHLIDNISKKVRKKIQSTQYVYKMQLIDYLTDKGLTVTYNCDYKSLVSMIKFVQK